MKYAYVVRGSQDGNLGVWSSRQKAVAHAVLYCSDIDDPYDESIDVDDRGNLVFVEGKGVSADVEKFVLA